MITRTNLRIRVARGLAWIKEHGLEYELDIDRVIVDGLVMNNPYRCILGQAFYGRLVRGYEAPFGAVSDNIQTRNPRRNIDFWLRQHGFDLSNEVDSDIDVWEWLRDAWAEVLQQDRDAARP